MLRFLNYLQNSIFSNRLNYTNSLMIAALALFLTASLPVSGLESEKTLVPMRLKPPRPKPKPKKPFYVLGASSQNSDMFSSFFTVLGLLQYQESAPSSGVRVDFGEKGPYYEPALGSNWWSYYFEPVHFGSRENMDLHVVSDDQMMDFCYNILFSPRNISYKLIQKYIVIRQDLLRQADEFAGQYFGAKEVIGVHYQKMESFRAPRVTHEQMFDHIDTVLANLGNTPSIIFASSDDQNFIEKLSAKYPNNLIFRDVPRSRTGLPPRYNDAIPKYSRGKDELLDALLLSKSGVLIRTSSNLSSFVSFYNPYLEVVTIKGTSWLPR